MHPTTWQELFAAWPYSAAVFDECHHATKNHAYVELLKALGDCPGEHRPRLLGRVMPKYASRMCVSAARGLQLVPVQEL